MESRIHLHHQEFYNDHDDVLNIKIKSNMAAILVNSLSAGAALSDVQL